MECGCDCILQTKQSQLTVFLVAPLGPISRPSGRHLVCRPCRSMDPPAADSPNRCKQPISSLWVFNLKALFQPAIPAQLQSFSTSTSTRTLRAQLFHRLEGTDIDMGDLQPVSIVDPEDCKSLITTCTQAYLDDLSELDVFFPTSSPPVHLISDGDKFYEVSLPRTPPPVGVDMIRPPTPTRETSLAAASMSSAAAVVDAAVHLPSFPPESTGTANTEVVAPQTTLSDDAARAQIEAYIRTSIWFRVHVLESLVGDPGVPVSALQLAKRGNSIWACFVKRVRRKGRLIFKCTSCGHESDRLHRAVGHQRTKLGHKPFACTDLGW